MRLTRHCVVLISILSAPLVACGEDDGGGDRAPVDAPKPVDAAVDAPAQLMGLGQKCVPSMQGADCPTSAPGCLSFGQNATSGICSKLCVQNGTFSTDSNANPTNMNPPDPTVNNSVCAAIYTGTVGSGVCNAYVNQMPPGNLQPNSNYTFQVACAVGCGANNACPTGYTCDTQTMWCMP
jgi:hypothetical protein